MKKNNSQKSIQDDLKFFLKLRVIQNCLGIYQQHIGPLIKGHATEAFQIKNLMIIVKIKDMKSLTFQFTFKKTPLIQEDHSTP